MIFATLFVAFYWIALSWHILLRLPSDAIQGVAQRIFYYHVPTAWVSFLGFFFAFAYSIRYLYTRSLEDDRRAFVFTMVGWIFTSGVLITGPLWAKPIWGHYWNWSDERLISFSVLWLIFTAYLMIRTNLNEVNQKARISAILGILGFLNVPLVYLAIRIWPTPSHPQAVIVGDKDSGVDPSMRLAFYLSLIAFTILFTLLTKLNLRIFFLETNVKKYLQK